MKQNQPFLRLAVRRVAFVVAVWINVTPALAVMPDEVLADPTLEARARALSQELRCLVCQNQSIDDSSAALARDLRLIVRERLSRGDSDAQVLDYLAIRYGNFVLLRPPVQADTMLLWLAPVLALASGGIIFGYYLWRLDRMGGGGASPLSEAERHELLALSGDE